MVQRRKDVIRALAELPQKIKKCLELDSQVKAIATRCVTLSTCDDCCVWLGIRMVSKCLVPTYTMSFFVALRVTYREQLDIHLITNYI